MTFVTGLSQAAYKDRLERRSEELILPDDYLDPDWKPPPVVDPLPPLQGEDDSVTSDPLDADEAELEELFGEDIIDVPFEDIGEDFGEDDVIEEPAVDERELPGLEAPRLIPTLP